MINKLNKNGKIHDRSITVIIDEINERIDLLNNILLMGEEDRQHIMPSDCFITGLTTVDDIKAVTTVASDIKCPHCGESYYTELYSTTTAVYYPPIYMDGVNINPDRNQTTTHCKCLNCGEEFAI